MQYHQKKKWGFSLIELCIVLVVLSIVISGGLTLTTEKVQQTQIENTLDELDELHTALRIYLGEYGRLPCPSSITLTTGNALYGRSDTDCADASPPAGMTRVEYPASSGNFVRIGGVPFYTLGLPEKYNADQFNNRYLYAVMESAITSLPAGTPGNMQVLDTSGTAIASDVVLVLVSPGASHRGAYAAKTGALISACNTSNRDGENCDGDGIFTDATFNDGTVAANFYDDLIKWSRITQLYQSVASTSTSTTTTSTSTSSTSSTSSSSGAAAVSGEVYASTAGTYNWKPPASFLGREIRVLAVGGGGAGANAYSGSNLAGGGGGGLCHSFPYTITSTDLTAGLTIRVGAGGVNAGNGGDSFVAPAGTTDYICLGGGGRGGGSNGNVAGGLGGRANGFGRGGNGGNGGVGRVCGSGPGSEKYTGGGGGAGGYRGNGGKGEFTNDCTPTYTSPTSGEGGGAPGGRTRDGTGDGQFGGITVEGGYGGTGVRAFGEITPVDDGVVEPAQFDPLDPDRGRGDEENCKGRNFGGGGALYTWQGGSGSLWWPGQGGRGIVRIIWGPDRSWPVNNVRLQEGTVTTY